MPEPITIDCVPGLFEGNKLTITPRQPKDRRLSFDIATTTPGEKPEERVVINVSVAHWDNKRAYVANMDKNTLSDHGSFSHCMVEFDGKNTKARGLETGVTRYNAKKMEKLFAAFPMSETFATMVRELVAVRNLTVPGLLATPKERLEYLRGEIEAERISYGEIAELQSLVQYIDPGDLLLLEWAGVEEFSTPDEEGAKAAA